MSLTPNPYARRAPAAQRGPDGLADVLERILDKGLVIAGDIQVNLLDIELLTIKVRLLLASADTAQQMGIDWWKHDPFLTSKDRELVQENEILRDRVDQLEAAMGGKLAPGEPSPGDLLGEGATDRGATRGQTVPTGALGNGRAEGASSDAEDASDETSQGAATSAHVEVDEVILEHEDGGAELRVTAADLEELAADEELATDPEAAPTDDDVEETGDWLDEETIAAMTRAELREELSARELSTSGTKQELHDRLMEALEDEWETVPAEQDAEMAGTR